MRISFAKISTPCKRPRMVLLIVSSGMSWSISRHGPANEPWTRRTPSSWESASMVSLKHVGQFAPSIRTDVCMVAFFHLSEVEASDLTGVAPLLIVHPTPIPPILLLSTR